MQCTYLDHPLHALLEPNLRLISQYASCLLDIMVPLRAGIRYPVPCEQSRMSLPIIADQHSLKRPRAIPSERDITHGSRTARFLASSVGGSSARHTRRMKSQKYTGSPLVMKNASPATRKGLVGARESASSENWQEYIGLIEVFSIEQLPLPKS